MIFKLFYFRNFDTYRKKKQLQLYQPEAVNLAYSSVAASPTTELFKIQSQTLYLLIHLKDMHLYIYYVF